MKRCHTLDQSSFPTWIWCSFHFVQHFISKIAVDQESRVHVKVQENHACLSWQSFYFPCYTNHSAMLFSSTVYSRYVIVCQ
jgi:hypothetical protein